MERHRFQRRDLAREASKADFQIGATASLTVACRDIETLRGPSLVKPDVR